MSQHTVEQVIGRLVTDEAFRRRFAADPSATLDGVLGCGCKLNPCERRALLDIDLRSIEKLSEAVDPRLLKVDLSGGLS